MDPRIGILLRGPERIYYAYLGRVGDGGRKYFESPDVKAVEFQLGVSDRYYTQRDGFDEVRAEKEDALLGLAPVIEENYE